RRPQRADRLGVLRIAGAQQQLRGRAQLLVVRMPAGGVAHPEQVRLARLLEVPRLARGLQALLGQGVVVAAQGAAGRGQGGGRAVVERGGGGGEGPAVVGRRIRVIG